MTAYIEALAAFLILALVFAVALYLAGWALDGVFGEVLG